MQTLDRIIGKSLTIKFFYFEHRGEVISIKTESTPRLSIRSEESERPDPYPYYFSTTTAITEVAKMWLTRLLGHFSLLNLSAILVDLKLDLTSTPWLGKKQNRRWRISHLPALISSFPSPSQVDEFGKEASSDLQEEERSGEIQTCYGILPTMSGKIFTPDLVDSCTRAFKITSSLTFKFPKMTFLRNKLLSQICLIGKATTGWSSTLVWL